MGAKSRDGDGSCLSDYLLYAAICMVGLPVEVQVKDGSLYSGILHTASFDEGHGIVLKKARKIGKGKHEKSFTVESLVDTLVVYSADFVQVVVKDFLLPAEGTVVNTACDGAVAGTNASQAYNSDSVGFEAYNSDSERAPKPLISSNSSPSRILEHNKEQMSLYGLGNKDAKIDMVLDLPKMLHNPFDDKQEAQARRQDTQKVQEDVPQGEGFSCNHVDEVEEAKEMECEDHSLTPGNVSPLQVGSVDATHVAIASRKAETRCGSPAARPVSPDDHSESIFTNSTSYPSLDAQVSTVSSHSTSVPNSGAFSCTSRSTSPNGLYSKNNSACKLSAKEFKLNPQAKVFCPMNANSRLSPTPVPTNASTGYVSNIPPVMPITAGQSGVEINSFTSPSTPVKLVQYDSLVTAHSGVPVQYSRPVIGHVNAWQQPVRFSGQYHPVQTGPAYVNPTSQTVMVGRTGQLVYVHPIAQDATQGASVFSQGSPYPLLNPCQTNLPKIQGAAVPPFQLCMAPPLVTGATQPFAVPGHIPFSQPYPAVRPILVPGGHGFFGNKLH